MSRNLLAGVAAGLIAFVALLSATAGNPFVQFLLFLAAPVPIYLVGLALGWQTAAVAAVTAGLAITVLTGPLAGLVSAGSQFGPPVILSYLVLLSREVQSLDGKSTAVEWYPVGRIVLWCAALGTVLSVLLLMLLGQDSAEVQGNLEKVLRQAVEQFRAQSGEDSPLSEEDLDAMTRVFLALLPAASGILMTGILLLNLYIAARVTRASGFLTRPWPEIAAMTFPPGTPLLLAASVLLSAVLSGFAGMAASAASGALYMAYVLLGLAVIHYVTRGNAGRFAILWSVYFGLVIFNTVVSLVLAIIGLSEPFSPLRRDFMRPPPPAGPPDPD